MAEAKPNKQVNPAPGLEDEDFKGSVPKEVKLSKDSGKTKDPPDYRPRRR